MNEPTYLRIPELARSYFRHPGGYFWRWAERGAFVEWANGRTLAYREELEALLDTLAPTGLPPLGSLLLLLAACGDSWAASDGPAAIAELLRTAPAELRANPAEDVASLWPATLALLNHVASLPAALRTGLGRLHLFRQLAAATTPVVAAGEAHDVVGEWTSGRLANRLLPGGASGGRGWLATDLRPLHQLAQQLTTPNALEYLLRTGFTQPPAPLPQLPEPPPPLATGDLLDVLTQNPRTAGVATLARHLLAGLHVPPHAQGASERPLGGVADLTNRGALDRLLLSELAQDDLTLTARLVNNEALYLRREEPPQPTPRPHTILLDTTLRLWGTPRAFGLAAALAWARLAAQPRVGAAVQAYALGGQAATALDLTTTAGVVAALELLDPAPHCGEALAAFAKTTPATQADYVLITATEQLQQPDFARVLASGVLPLRFLLAVDRGGTLTRYEWVGGHRQEQATTHYDLEELLFPAERPAGPLPELPPDAPAFLRQQPVPLFYPNSGLRLSSNNAYFSEQLGVVAITDRQRVLYWPSPATGARELLPAIEGGSYFFGTDHASYFTVLVSRPNLRVHIYKFMVRSGEVLLVELPGEHMVQRRAPRVAFYDSCYYVQPADTNVYVFDCAAWALRPGLLNEFPSVGQELPASPLAPIKRFLNNGYNVLYRVKSLEINLVGELVVSGHQLVVTKGTGSYPAELRLLAPHTAKDGPPLPLRATPTEAERLPANPLVTLRRFGWPDGSQCVLDSRALLHLRSADPTLPELTLVLVMGQPTAAWAADGSVCGPDYFTGPDPWRRLPAPEFYQRYIQPFIAHLGQ